MIIKRGYNPKKYFFWAVIFLLLILSYFIIKPFLISIISGFVLAFLIKPVFDKLKKIFPESFVGILCLLIFILMLIIPIFFLTKTIIDQISSSSINLENVILEIEKKGIDIPLKNKLDIFSTNLDYAYKKILEYLFNLLIDVVLKIPFFILSLFITFLTSYFVLLNWNFLSNELKEILPFKDKKRIINEISNSTKQIIHGYFLLAIIEFFLALIGFYISGVDFFAIAAIFIGFSALLPGIGPAAVWVPLFLYYLIFSKFSIAIGILITGLILSIFIDGLLGIKLIGRKARINPVIYLLGIIGGISLFGIFGFIIGPLILSNTLKLIIAALEEK